MSLSPSKSSSDSSKERHYSGECKKMSAVEAEAFAAIREMAAFVKIICLSDVLCRTPDLLFLNIVTYEDRPYCVELSQRGWRICSDRQDCMYGDFRQLELYARYFETIYQLLDTISLEYRKRFSDSLAEKLRKLAD